MKKSLTMPVYMYYTDEGENPRSRTLSIYWNDKGDRKIKFTAPLPSLFDSITALRTVICRNYIITLATFKDRAI